MANSASANVDFPEAVAPPIPTTIGGAIVTRRDASDWFRESGPASQPFETSFKRPMDANYSQK